MPAVINLDGSATAYDLSVSPFTGWQHGRIDASAVAHVASFARRSCHLKGWLDLSPFRDPTRTTFAVAHEVRMNPEFESRFIQVTDLCYAICAVSHVGNSSCAFLTKVYLLPKSAHTDGLGGGGGRTHDIANIDNDTWILKGPDGEHPSAAQLKERDYHEWMMLAADERKRMLIEMLKKEHLLAAEGERAKKTAPENTKETENEKESRDADSTFDESHYDFSHLYPVELGMTTLTLVYISYITRKSLPFPTPLRDLLSSGKAGERVAEMLEAWKRRSYNPITTATAGTGGRPAKVNYPLMRRGGDKLFSMLEREALTFSASPAYGEDGSPAALLNTFGGEGTSNYSFFSGGGCSPASSAFVSIAQTGGGCGGGANADTEEAEGEEPTSTTAPTTATATTLNSPVGAEGCSTTSPSPPLSTTSPSSPQPAPNTATDEEQDAHNAPRARTATVPPQTTVNPMSTSSSASQYNPNHLLKLASTSSTGLVPLPFVGAGAAVIPLTSGTVSTSQQGPSLMERAKELAREELMMIQQQEQLQLLQRPHEGIEPVSKIVEVNSIIVHREGGGTPPSLASSPRYHNTVVNHGNEKQGTVVVPPQPPAATLAYFSPPTVAYANMGGGSSPQQLNYYQQQQQQQQHPSSLPTTPPFSPDSFTMKIQNLASPIPSMRRVTSNDNNNTSSLNGSCAPSPPPPTAAAAPNAEATKSLSPSPIHVITPAATNTDIFNEQTTHKTENAGGGATINAAWSLGAFSSPLPLSTDSESARVGLLTTCAPAGNTARFTEEAPSPLIRRHMAIFTNRRALRPADFDFNLHMNMNMYVSSVLDALKYAMRDFLDLQRKQAAFARAREEHQRALAALSAEHFRGLAGAGGGSLPPTAAHASEKEGAQQQQQGTPIVSLDYQFPVVAICDEDLYSTAPTATQEKGDDHQPLLSCDSLVSVHHLGEVLGRLGYQSVVSKFTNKSHRNKRRPDAAAALESALDRERIAHNRTTRAAGVDGGENDDHEDHHRPLDYMSRQITGEGGGPVKIRNNDASSPSSSSSPSPSSLPSSSSDPPKRDAYDMTRFASIEECVLISRIEYLKEVTELTSELEVTVMIPPPPPSPQAQTETKPSTDKETVEKEEEEKEKENYSHFHVDPLTLRVGSKRTDAKARKNTAAEARGNEDGKPTNNGSSSSDASGSYIPIHYTVRCIPPSWVEDPTPFIASSGELVLRPVDDLAVYMPILGGGRK